MPQALVFSVTERERLGVLVNNLSIYAAQMMLQGSPDLSRRALSNLTRVKKDDEPLLKRLEEIARELGDESPYRVIEDLARLLTDMAQAMTLVRRCLLASAFLGHCLAQPSQPAITTEAQGSEKRLH